MAYEQRTLLGNLRIRQVNREVLTLEVRLPIDLALRAMPLAQRLVDAPLQLGVRLRQPQLAALHRWRPSVPPLTGTLQGTLGLQGSYAALSLNADVQVQNVGLVGIAEHIDAPVHLTAEMVSAASVQGVAQALRQRELTAKLQDLVLRVPTLEGRLPDQTGAPQPFRVRDLLLRAGGQWSPEGFRATLETLQLQASAFGLPPAELKMAAHWTPQQLELTTLRVSLADSEVHGQGRVAMATQQLQFRFEIPRLRLDVLPIAWPTGLPSVVQGDVRLDGSVQAPQVEARLRYAGGQILADLAA
jgi:autotransporter translocation and assembly factor TamB